MHWDKPSSAATSHAVANTVRVLVGDNVVLQSAVPEGVRDVE